MILRTLGVRVVISAPDETVRKWIIENFGAMLVDGDNAEGTAVSLSIERAKNAYCIFDLEQPQQTRVEAKSPAEVLYRLEKRVIIELQRRRSDLLFMHAAAVERDGQAYLLAGDTGAGKSTTTWGLLRHGFGYLSDELAPIDLGSMQVLPYPHALNLKRRPDPPYALPSATLDLGRTLHVPAARLGAPVITESRALAAVFILRHDPIAPAPEIRRLTAAEAAARLYVTGLNTLAHQDAGLPSVLEVTSSVPCFSIVTAELAQSCVEIESTIARLNSCQ